MKTISLFLMILSLNAYASSPNCSDESSSTETLEQKEINTAVPSHLKGATITVTLADGRSSIVSAEKFKVVPRLQQYLTTKVQVSNTRTCSVEANKKRNRISVLGGYGSQDGLDLDNSQAPNKVSVQNKAGSVLGLQYQRETDIELLGMPLSGGIQLQDNHTGSLLIGVDF